MVAFIGNGLQGALVGRLWSIREFRAQQKSCGQELFMTACDSCSFATRENNLLERHRWQFLTSDHRFKQYLSLKCQGNHEHVWKQTSEGSAMIRRLVNGFVHDHMVGQLQCDSCLESSDAQNAQQVSLATPPKLWQAVKVDIFELEDSQRKGFFALYMDAACKLSSCSCFLEWTSRTVRLSFHIWPRIGCSITRSSNF